MKPLPMLCFGLGSMILVVGVLFAFVTAGDDGLNMPVLIGAIAVGGVVEAGGVALLAMQRR